MVLTHVRVRGLGSAQVPWAIAGGVDRFGEEVCHLSLGVQTSMSEC